MALLRVAVVAACLAGGVVVGVLSVVVHSWWWGLLLALAAVAATLVALPAGWGRLPFALAWTATVGLLAVGRPEGDILVAQDAAGVVLVLAAPVVVVGGFLGLLGPRPASPPEDPDTVASET